MLYCEINSIPTYSSQVPALCALIEYLQDRSLLYPYSTSTSAFDNRSGSIFHHSLVVIIGKVDEMNDKHLAY
jgi:hypothetical protein